MLLGLALAGRSAHADPEWTDGYATYYGLTYNGQPLACGGVYASSDSRILAVGPALYGLPCGAEVEVCGPGGCAIVERRDSCPGCSANVLDLSEAANELVCGAPPHTCRVVFRLLAPVRIVAPLTGDGGLLDAPQ